MPISFFAFHIHARPAGANRDLDGKPCSAGRQPALSAASNLRMDDELLEQYIRQYIAAQAGDVVTFAWRGGEPASLGLDFFQRAVALAHRFARPGVTVEHTIQTDGALLDDAWCEFLRAHNFLVELIVDDPATHARALDGAARLRAHRVDFNTLTCVHADNAARPLEVYRFLRDEAGSEWVQFMPVVEHRGEEADENSSADLPGCAAEGRRSVAARQWGEFLCAVYDEWVRHDVGRVYVNFFEAALAAWLGAPQPLCIFCERCGDALALEPNGDLYCCERYVNSKHLLGNIRRQPLLDLAGSPQQRQFGTAKALLPEQCRACPVRFACHGECPKNRLLATDADEPPLNYLCAGYFRFFTHIDRTMRVMAQLYRMGRPPAEVMALLAAEDARWRQAAAALRRNALCPCGSGKKVRQCHGQI